MTSSTTRTDWTYERLATLPADGQRYEIIAGELFAMPSPNSAHAIVVANLFFFLAQVVRALGGRVFTAPIDLFLPDADPVQPDLLVLLPEQLALISRRGVEGPPALVVEILSPSNPDHDRIRKRRLYAQAGIPEYWLVDPERHAISVLVLVGSDYGTHRHATRAMLVTSTVLPALTFPADQAFR